MTDEPGWIYREVSASHPALAEAKRGVCVAADTRSNVSPEAHNERGASARSAFTSWTHDLGLARRYAVRTGPGGVILRAGTGAPPPDASWRWEFSPDIWYEAKSCFGCRGTGCRFWHHDNDRRRRPAGPPYRLPEFGAVTPAPALLEAEALMRQADMHPVSEKPVRITVRAALDIYGTRHKNTDITGLRPPGLPQLIDALAAAPPGLEVDINHMSRKAGHVSLFAAASGAPLGLVVLPPARNGAA